VWSFDGRSGRARVARSATTALTTLRSRRTGRPSPSRAGIFDVVLGNALPMAARLGAVISRDAARRRERAVSHDTATETTAGLIFAAIARPLTGTLANAKPTPQVTRVTSGALRVLQTARVAVAVNGAPGQQRSDAEEQEGEGDGSELHRGGRVRGRGWPGTKTRERGFSKAASGNKGNDATFREEHRSYASNGSVPKVKSLGR
jgi:hypothetical protein